MEKIKVLFIDDRQSEFDLLNMVFEAKDYFELVNQTPMFDEGSRTRLSRETQKGQIIKLLKEEDYQIILFDFSLRGERLNNISSSAARNLLSIEIYDEMKEWFKMNDKKFVFVTAHADWASEEKFKRIGEVVEGAYFLRKVRDAKENYLACIAYDIGLKTKCGEIFNGCSAFECFNNILRRIAEND